ncbi:MAG: phosphopantetheine-binding protein [Bacillota bacterium]|nr:phosphopantetheine-binding protein [Bacillota bacterium]
MENIVFEILKDICGEDLRGESEVNLFQSGRLDSLGVIELFVAIEEKFNITLDPAMVNRSEIETPQKIISYLKMAGLDK